MEPRILAGAQAEHEGWKATPERAFIRGNNDKRFAQSPMHFGFLAELPAMDDKIDTLVDPFR